MPDTNTPPEPQDSGIVCLLTIARLFGIAADADVLRHRFIASGTGSDNTTLCRIAISLGLKARSVTASRKRLEKIPLPALAQCCDGRWVVLAKVAAEQVLLDDPHSPHPVTLSRAQFQAGWNGRLILVTHRAAQPCSQTRFGYRWFIPALIRYRTLFGEVLVASFFLQLFALVTPLFFQLVIDKVLVHKGLTTLDVLAFGLLVVSVFDVLLSGLRTYVFSHTTNRVDVELGARLYRHLLSLPMSYFSARRVGDSVARVRELDSIRNFITGATLTVIVDLSFSFVFLAVMYYYSPLLTAIVLASIPLYVLLSLLITPLLRARASEKFNRGAENQAFLVESVHGVETLKSMAVEPQLQQRWEEQLAGYVQASFKSANLGNIAAQLAALINKLVVVMILWTGARSVLQGDLSVGQLIAFNMLAARVSSPVLRLVQLWQDFQQAGIAVERLGDILNTPAEPGYDRSRVSLPALQGHIVFEQLNFRYRADSPEVLSNVTLDIAAGEVIGIVGQSGSGKSTLTRLIQRLYVPDHGRLLIDGVNTAAVDSAWLRRQIGVVLQENVLFNRTVRDNIALADPGIPMQRVMQAARLAGAHEFILQMPQGYDSLVGEQGANLSGGQRQRIAIARALVRDPRILILDEATSALDYESERVIQRNMNSICAGRTVIIIAHRLTSVRAADRIVVMEAGRVVEQGSHDSLLERRGQYARLHAMQFDRDMQTVCL